jgi:histidinol-phosphate aminotransferase
VKKNDPLRGVKEQVLKVPAYTLHAYEAAVKLNQNENPFDFPEDLKDETFRRFREREWSRYPEFVPDDLRARLARFTGWCADGILVGNGSNELLQAVLMVLVNDGTRVAIPSPTFTVYRLISTILGADVVDIPLDEDMSFNVDMIISRARESGAGVVIINNPNNPTGSAIAEDAVRSILDQFEGFVLLDEAYYEFCGRSGFGLLAEYPRLIITRTFSKAMGMAGLRLGYLMAHPDLVEQIAKAKLPYNINQFSLTAAEVALENSERFRPAIEIIMREKKRLEKDLADLPGVRVYPSESNFFLIGVPVSPRKLFDYLYARGILVRDVSSYPMLSRCLRLNVGKPDENDRLLTVLRSGIEYLNGPGEKEALASV